MKKFKPAVKNIKGKQRRSIDLELRRQHKDKGKEFYDGTFSLSSVHVKMAYSKKKIVNLTSFLLSLALWLRKHGTKRTRGNNQPNGKECEETEKLDCDLERKTLTVSDTTLRRVDTTKTNAEKVWALGELYELQ